MKKLIAVALGVIVALGLTSCDPADTSTPKPNPDHKVQPAPNPDPVKPNPSSSGDDQVEILFVVSHQERRVVYVYNIGQGPQKGASEHRWGGETSWTETVTRGQIIQFAAAHSSDAQGWLTIQVTQTKPKRTVCKDNNDEDPVASVACSGEVK